ncbi:MAG: MAPEG family protein [Sneathiella sp.]
MSLIFALSLYGLLTLLLLGNEIFFTYATQGFGYGFSANRASVERSALALRIQRTYQNQIESAAYVVPVLAAGAVIGLQGNGVELAALLLVIGRAAFAVLYYTGIPFIRVPAFLMCTLSTLYLIYAILTSATM